LEDAIAREVVADIYSIWEAHAKSCGRCILALRGGVGIGFGMRTAAEPCDEGRELLGEARFQVLDLVCPVTEIWRHICPSETTSSPSR
jgi:hypothetical protein